MIASVFRSRGIEFDFYVGDLNVPDSERISTRKNFYKRVLDHVASKPTQSYIAGGYFTKYVQTSEAALAHPERFDQLVKDQRMDIYIRYDGKENNPDYSMFDSLLQPQFRIYESNGGADDEGTRAKRSKGDCYEWLPCTNKNVYCKKLITLPLDGLDINICVRITSASNVLGILNTFDFHPSQIAYSYSENKFFFNEWFITGGPMNTSESNALIEKYKYKNFDCELFNRYFDWISFVN